MRNKEICKVKGCGKEQCHEHCQVAANGCHQADPKSARAANSVDWIIDFWCRHCGQSGAVKVDPADIQWK